MVQMDLPELLCRVNFPLYNVAVVSPRHILVAGGGGAARTGVQNGVQIFEISHNGEHCVAESINHFGTGDFAIMNLSAGNWDPKLQKTLVAVGQNERAQVYSLQLVRERKPSVSLDDEDDEDGDGGSGGIRKRHHSLRSSPKSEKKNDAEFAATAGITDGSCLVFAFRPLKSVQTDFTVPEPYQKVVRISSDGKLMATGGDDGNLRVWTFPSLDPVHDIDAHQKEIDDLEFSPDDSKLATISKDGRALVWDVKKGKKHAEMGWDPPNNLKYLYKRLRFGKVENDPKKYKVYTIVNPVGASKPPAYLQRWDSRSYTVEQRVEHEGSLSALAVSDNGNFVATGAMFDGTVEIYISFNLQKIKRVEKSHSTFITGLEFLPCGEESDAVRGFTDASVVSISVDHQVCIHHIPRLRTVSVMLAGSIIAIFLIATFIICSYLGI